MSEVNHHVEQKEFDWDLRITKDQLPDPQCFHVNDVEGGQVAIPKVGISKLDFPINLLMRDGSHQLVHGVVSAYVSLDDPIQKGINMSRIVRYFYDKLEDRQGVDLDEFFEIVEDYKRELPSKNAYLKVRFELPLRKKALREDHYGWIYYPVTLEISNTEEFGIKSYLSLTYKYTSACVCSASLAEFSRTKLDTPAISHSQRSVAEIKVEFDHSDTNTLWIEDLVDLARQAQVSELLPGITTRVMEFSYSQLVASKGVVGFIECVLRRMYAALNNDPRIKDFAVGATHEESLNFNFASGAIYKGIPGGLR